VKKEEGRVRGVVLSRPRNIHEVQDDDTPHSSGLRPCIGPGSEGDCRDKLDVRDLHKLIVR
jgi:hypothetical protein